MGFWPKKVWKNPRGRASFPPGVFPGFHRMLCIRDGGFAAGPEAITAPSQLSFQSTACVRFLVRPRSFRLCGVQGDHPPGWGLGRTAPAFLLVCFPIVFFTLHTDTDNNRNSKKRSRQGSMNPWRLFFSGRWGKPCRSYAGAVSPLRLILTCSGGSRPASRCGS